jgi:YHS domain-containing protein
MRKTGWIVATAVTMVLAIGVWAGAEDKVEPLVPTVERQTICPVMGGKIDKRLFVDYEGKRLYVCCNGCIGAVKKDPAKWFKKVEDEGITLDKAQVNCPVTGGPIDKKIFADYEGKRVYFCCAGCVDKFNADAKAIVAKMGNDGIVLDNAPAPAKEQKTGSVEKAPAEGHDHSTMK